MSPSQPRTDPAQETFLDPEDFESSVTVVSDRYPLIPEAVTSFGAAIAGNSLYIYGGHTGPAHQYFNEAQAHTLRRIDIENPKSWENLGTGPRLQGLAMVSHDGKLYRLGGFTAKNSEGESKDFWSQSKVTSFDPATRKWQDLPPLPEPRSSFDAVVLGDTTFVIGGWSMQGEADATLLKTACSLDLSAPTLQWQPLPVPPFQRRALSFAALGGKVYVIGGMQQQGGPTTHVRLERPLRDSREALKSFVNDRVRIGLTSRDDLVPAAHHYAAGPSRFLQRPNAGSGDQVG